MIRKLASLALSAALALAVAIAQAAAAEANGGFVLTTVAHTGEGFTPAFVGNGYLGARIPFDGQGYHAEPVATVAQVQGFYGKRRLLPWSAKVEARAAPPIWSALDFDDGSGRFALDKGKVERYRQSLDLRTGTLSTDVAWVSPAGREVSLHYDVVPDRARPHAALVRLRFTPGFSGRVNIVDPIDPATGALLNPTAASGDGQIQFVDMITDGVGITATVASTLTTAGAIARRADAPKGGAAQQLVLDVSAGETYEVLKTVGVAVSSDGEVDASAHDRAIAAARTEATLGYDRARSSSDAAWAALWAADIQIDGAEGLQRAGRMALFTLFASARSDLSWAPSPGGLSNAGYMGHVFWDSETWMFPIYLALAPDIASRLLQYRLDRLPAAEALAAAGGSKGARFPWESGLSGNEAVQLGGYGHELHISSDIALAAWQYWIATGDAAWLERAYPMLAGIADFWTSYATPNADGSRSILGVLPPDEDVLARSRFGGFAVLMGGGRRVDDSAYTDITAERALTIADEAARLLGRPPNPQWEVTARRMRAPVASPDGVVGEYRHYAGEAIKQADVMLLAYPWEALDAHAASANLEFYAPRTNPDGPSMTDAIHSIVASKVGVQGCAAYSFTRRSVDPFLRPPYSQLSETRDGGVVTFATGAGGFLQEFLYGYAGLRWRDDRLWLDPSLPPQLKGVTIAALRWHGRVLRVEVEPQGTTVTLISGAPMRIDSPTGSTDVAVGVPVMLKTRLPAETDSGNLALCRAVVDSESGERTTAANDGSDATVWIDTDAGRSLTVDFERTVALDKITISRPAAIAVPGSSILGPAIAPAALLSYQQTAGERVAASRDGVTWVEIGRTTAPQVRDDFSGGGVLARYLKIDAPDAAAARPPVVGKVPAEDAHPEKQSP